MNERFHIRSWAGIILHTTHSKLFGIWLWVDSINFLAKNSNKPNTWCLKEDKNKAQITLFIYLPLLSYVQVFLFARIFLILICVHTQLKKRRVKTCIQRIKNSTVKLTSMFKTEGKQSLFTIKTKMYVFITSTFWRKNRCYNWSNSGPTPVQLAPWLDQHSGSSCHLLCQQLFLLLLLKWASLWGSMSLPGQLVHSHGFNHHLHSMYPHISISNFRPSLGLGECSLKACRVFPPRNAWALSC